MSTQTFPQMFEGQNQPRWYYANADFEADEFKANGPCLCCVPVNPWLLGAMGKGLCCIASWWSFVSCGEIAAEEDCESEREGRERNWGNGKTQEEGKTEQKHHSQYRHIHRENLTKENSHSPLNTVHLLKKFYMDHWCLTIGVFLVLSMWGTPKAFLQSAGCISW